MSSLFSGMALSLASIGFLLIVLAIYLIKGRQNKGKGINDMSTGVAMCTINELLSLDDKTEAIRILEDTVENHSDEEVRDNARSIKALMALS